MERTQETIENKYKDFLELLKTNPEAIEGQVMKNEYRKLLNAVIEEAQSNYKFAYNITLSLLKLDILEKSEIKELYKDFLKTVFEEAKSNFNLAQSVPELIKLDILEKCEIKELYKDLLKAVVEEAKSNDNWAMGVVPELIKLDILEKSKIEELYKDLLKAVIEEAKLNDNWAKNVLPELIKLDILEKSEIKELYKDLLKAVIEEARSKFNVAEKVVPELLKLNILEKSDKERYKDLVKTVIEEAKSDFKLAYEVVPELLKLNILEKSDKERYKDLVRTVIEEAISNVYCGTGDVLLESLLKFNLFDKADKEWYKELLKKAFKVAKSDNNLATNDVLVLLKLNILDGTDKERCKKLFGSFVEEGKLNSKLAYYVIPTLLRLNILNKTNKERYKDLLKTAIGEAKYDFNLAEYVVPELLKLNILEKGDKERYKNLLKIVIEEAKSNFDLAKNVVPELIKLDILGKSEIKELCKDLLRTVVDVARSDNIWARNVLPELLKLNIIDQTDKERYKNLLKTAIKESSYVVLEQLLKLNILEKSDKERYKNLLKTVIKESRSIAIEQLLKLNIIDQTDKERYYDLLKTAIGEAKYDFNLAEYAVPELLKLNILEKSDKERYKELLKISIEGAKIHFHLAQCVVPELLKLNILDETDKERYKELLGSVVEEAKLNSKLAYYVVPELLKLNILKKGEMNFDIRIPQNITLIGTSFFARNKNKISVQDIEFIDKLGDYFTKEEINYLYKQEYEYFKEVEIMVNENDYQAIRKIKRNCYPYEENRRLKELEEYFGKGIWTYFVDKVPGNKLLKNRFRDPHNALLNGSKIIILAADLENKGISRENFLKNYLGIAGDRNNGYQQLNHFLENYKKNWKELVEGVMKNEFSENTEFMSFAEGILEQEKTGKLYKNLDNLEQILILLHMIRNKEALIKLQELSSSDDPKDRKLYEYYKGAIYHPRTKPIIMQMYENPGEFLGLDETTFIELNKIHQAKKPSNMVENFEFLDFDAKDLVDCLPLGIYDQLSYFKPFEMKFYMSGSEAYTQDELKDRVNKFLKSVNQKKIINIIKKLKENGDETMWYQMWNENKGRFIDELTTKYTPTYLIDLFVRLGYSEFNKYIDLRLMTAKISPKSDPNNRFNGFNCDSLAEGHGKKVVAMFNPYCTDFCIYEGDQDPNEDNLKVTSWVTLNRKIPENFETLLGKVKSETTHDIANVLGDKFEDYKDPNEYVITMDNIEANPNFGNKYAVAVRKMYEKFFSEYVRENPVSPNGIPINTHKFYSGVNYNKIDILDKQVPNESLPVFVNAYSDNSESYSLQGDLDAGEQKEKEKKVGVQPLSIEDVVQISYMEGKIYPASMKDHLGNLQHEITASILNNTLKGRPNLSFAWYNEEGKIGGYILAYQGKMEDGTPGVYISDFAMDEKYRGRAGIKMIQDWMKEVKEKYPDMPVFTRARENTSYRMIKAYAEKQGYQIAKDEIVEDCGEIFHRVVMNPKK